ncbi:cadherin EGF LAG seven-pass G-type receptor 2-like [Pomacea canaliculata]|uniref:cadherin EGF LAG seven-pass G-type receptor 2-like n=1 Tax=Pomacea canaliculata TaxID=400727 RepID=UPI000D7281DF|nr:cadherin EGF LAG seven-pass G-type receptor 2-like [Pomacea canaliculata]XP_025106913.1 cadherin EGF LAG seven-pass G-type receptor 2-like [Pomacea canaliculata]
MVADESYTFRVTVTPNASSTTCELELSFVKLGPGFSLDCVEKHFQACSFLRPCRNGATCIPGGGGGLNYTCSCPSGWQGINCTQEDLCTQIPCQNKGKCIFQGHQRYTCVCPENFFGDVCQHRNICSADSPCQNGGSCHTFDNGTYSCSCPDHFTGTNCSLPDPCSPSPCGTGGDCIKVSETEANCSCYTGRYGSTCSEVNICELDSPCRHGQCISLGNSSFTCNCTSSYTGAFCDTFNPCSLNPCQNNATCHFHNNGQYNCTCSPGYYGDECQHYNRCYGNPCNKGSCNENLAEPLCSCPLNYDGDYCERYDPCLNDPCGGHGECVVLPNNMTQGGGADFECRCTSSWFGVHCENVNSCFLNVCKNGAKCENEQPNKFRCTCSPGFYEADCSRYNPCEAPPGGVPLCKNGGKCYNTSDGNFSCACEQGYFGPQCQRKDPCSSSPCTNNGTCTSLTDTQFSCTCSEEYTGDLCQLRNPCYKNLCQNGGLCRWRPEAGENISCACPEGYLGYYCQIRDPCYENDEALSLCGHGSCQAVNRSLASQIKENIEEVDFLFLCRCYSGFTGSRCEDPVSPCVDQVCLNNGNCQHGICVCPPLFTGSRCETQLSPCDLDPCGPGLRCQNSGTSYTCICLNGQTPPLCKPVCREEVTYSTKTGRFKWPQTGVDENARVFCPFGGKMGNESVATRKCLSASGGNAIWASYNDSDCRELDLMEAGRRLSLLKNLTSTPSSLGATDVDNITSALEELYSFTLMEQSIAEDLMNVISNLADVNSSITIISNKNNATSDRLLKLLNDFSADVIVKPGSNITMTSPNFEVVAVDVNDTASDVMYIPSIATGGSVKQLDVTITIPKQALELGRDQRTPPTVTRVQLAGHRKSQFFIPNDLVYGNDVIQTKPVITATIKGKEIVNLTSPVVYKIRNLHVSSNYTCVFWDPDNHAWSTEGVVTVSKSGDYTECQSTHLTSFAVLLDPSPGFALSSAHEMALTYISYIGSGLSLVCLVVTTLTYSLFRSLNKDKSGKILLNLCVALLLLNIVFLANGLSAGSDNSTRASCTAVAVILHYLLLASLAWMLVEAVEMYRALVTVFSKYAQCYMLKRCVVGWGAPVLIVAITLGVSREHYQSNADFCFLSRSSPIAYYASLVAPACLVLLVNTIIFIMVTRVILKPRFQQQKKDQEGITPAQVRGAFTVMFLLGVTWVFGPLAINEAKVVFNYLFCILNSLQGFLIFVFRCLFNPEARLAWVQLIKTGTLKKRRGPVPSTFSSDSSSKCDSHLKSSATGTFHSRQGGGGHGGSGGDSYVGSTTTTKTSLIQSNGWHPKMNGYAGAHGLGDAGDNFRAQDQHNQSEEKRTEQEERDDSKEDPEDEEQVSSELDYGSSELNKGDGKIISPAVEADGNRDGKADGVIIDVDENGENMHDLHDSLEENHTVTMAETTTTLTSTSSDRAREEQVTSSHVTSIQRQDIAVVPRSSSIQHESSDEKAMLTSL